jgi:PAS domain S-box-containing protein
VNYRLLSLTENAPHGFQYISTLDQKDVRRWPFALLASTREVADTALEPFGASLAGIIVTLGSEHAWQSHSLSPQLFYCTLPYNLKEHAAHLLRAHLELLETCKQAENRIKQQQQDLARAYEESNRTKQEFIQIKRSLVEELSERRLVEEALRKSETHYRLLTENATDVVWKLDNEFRFTYISPADERLRGYRAEEVLGHHVFEIFDEEGITVLKNAIRQRQEEEQCSSIKRSISFEVRHRCKDGSWVWGEVNSIQDRSDDGRLIGYHGISREITERKKHEQEQLKIDKLESLGVLAGGIAHDFNNILTGVMGYISFAQKLIEPKHLSLKPLSEAEKASARAAELAHQLLTFARGGEPIKKIVSLRDLVYETASLVLHGSNVKENITIPDSLHAIKADEGQLSQVFHNIIINATHAMPDGGTLSITAHNEIHSNSTTLELPPGPYVNLAFSDHGCGISEENIKKIFDPYFSTKSTGSGLGLASANSIVNRHGGLISVSSVEGCGTTFTLHLPSLGVTQSNYQMDNVVQAESDHTGGSILVMDDEDMIREMITEMLKYLGYQVTTCRNGEEAIALYREALEAGEPFAAVIMDLTIPGGMGGKDAAGHILALDPTAQLIVSSGYSNDPIVSDFSSYGFAAAVAKPYRISELGQLLSSLFLIP